MFSTSMVTPTGKPNVCSITTERPLTPPAAILLGARKKFMPRAKINTPRVMMEYRFQPGFERRPPLLEPALLRQAQHLLCWKLQPCIHYLKQGAIGTSAGKKESERAADRPWKEEHLRRRKRGAGDFSSEAARIEARHAIKSGSRAARHTSLAGVGSGAGGGLSRVRSAPGPGPWHRATLATCPTAPWKCWSRAMRPR